MKPYFKYKTLQSYANAVARANGHGSATSIVIRADATEPKIEDFTRHGHRKKSNGQYVHNAYLMKGWSSCYYQAAKTVVAVPVEVYNFFALLRDGLQGYEAVMVD